MKKVVIYIIFLSLIITACSDLTVSNNKKTVSTSRPKVNMVNPKNELHLKLKLIAGGDSSSFENSFTDVYLIMSGIINKEEYIGKVVSRANRKELTGYDKDTLLVCKGYFGEKSDICIVKKTNYLSVQSRDLVEGSDNDDFQEPDYAETMKIDVPENTNIIVDDESKDIKINYDNIEGSIKNQTDNEENIDRPLEEGKISYYTDSEQPQLPMPGYESESLSIISEATIDNAWLITGRIKNSNNGYMMYRCEKPPYNVNVFNVPGVKGIKITGFTSDRKGMIFETGNGSSGIFDISTTIGKYTLEK
ncbi:MAG: hypothetical protein Q8903_05985 [Bacteroidota bacterium]|nr:hypothetical protein [Bacteroidota bacterium]